MIKSKVQLRAQITVYAALSFLLVISLVTACIRSAIQSGAVLEVEVSARLATESAFSGYHNALLDEFDVFGLNKEKVAENVLLHVAEANVKGLCSEKAVQFVNAQITDFVRMTDRAGIGMENQVVAYMELGIYSDLLKNILDIESSSKKAQKICEVTENIAACEEELLQLDAIILEVVSLVEGIQTNSYGLVIRNKKAVPTNDYFAKAMITAPLTMQTAAIDSSPVYAAVSANGTKYLNVNEFLDGMKEYAEIYCSCITREDGGDRNAMDACARYYKNNLELLQNAAIAVRKKTQAALEKLNEYNRQFDLCNVHLSNCIQEIEQNKELLGEELYHTLKPDVEEISQNPNALGKSMCNAAFMRVGLQTNLDVLNRVEKALLDLDDTITGQNCSGLPAAIEHCRGLFKGLSNALLKFNYAGIQFNGSGEGLKVIEAIKNTLADGVCGLVLGEKKVSDAKVSLTDLASSHMDNSAGDSSDSSFGILEQSKRQVFLNQYILQRFGCCTDYLAKQDDQDGKAAEGAEQEQWCELAYPLEYILCGKASDKENLNEVILKISVIREGINLTHLITDRKKKNEAFSLAGKLVGYTGNTAIIKIAQYFIMGVWAYGESICDIKKMINGETVPLVKSDNTWQLSLDKLLTMSFEDGKKEDGKDQTASAGVLKGELTYQDYLGMLLLMQDAKKKRFRMMDVMELRMIALGDEAFRMKDYIWEATAEITVKMQKTGEYYVRKVAYSYV